MIHQPNILTRKVLIIRFSSIGDIVLTTPVIRAVYEQTGAEIHFLTKKQFAPLVAHHPSVSKVITLSDNFNELVRELKSAKYDLILDLHHNLRTKRLKMALQRPSHAFHKLNLQKWLLVRFGINRLPDIHIVDRYMNTTHNLGLKNDGKGVDIFIPPDRHVEIESVFGVRPFQFIAVVVGAAHQTKCLTAEQITALCDILPHPIVLMGGPNEKEKALQIIRSSKNEQVKNACGGFDILQSASILQQSSVVLAHDTGLMHLAAALRKPQVVIWGNTVPEFGMYPYYGKDGGRWESVEQKELSCRPCSKIGFEACPKGHFKCIMQHDMQEVASKVVSLIGK